MTVKEIISQLEKANPDDTVMVAGKSETETHYLLGKKRLQVVDKYNTETKNVSIGRPGDTLCATELGETKWVAGIPMLYLSPQFEGGMFFNSDE